MQNQSLISAVSSSLLSGSDSVISVFGHRNPDSDSICSALVTADWLNYTGRPARPFRAGELTPETQYILQMAAVSAPDLLVDDLTDKPVWLVDFSDVEQGPSTLADSNVIGLIDHHRIGTLITRNPPDVWVRAVGCCATVILGILTHETPMPLREAQAILLLGAILSDTVALTAPTTTEQDRQAVATLRALVHLDYAAFVAGLLAAKTAIAGCSDADLLQRDAKNYQIHGWSVLLGQIELLDMADITPRLAGLTVEIAQARRINGLDMVALILTDITRGDSVVYFSDHTLTGCQMVSLPGMTSRKKQILPWLTTYLSSQAR